MNLTLRQLQVFRTFARTSSVTDTAAQMSISQPAISQALKEIESQLGFKLFHRLGGRAHLSSEAREILPEVERLLAQYTALRSRARELSEGHAGKLSIAGVSTLFTDVMPSALAEFRRNHLSVKLRLEIHVAKDVARLVRLDEFDRGYAFLPVDDPLVDVRPVARMRAVCVLPREHPLAHRPALYAKDLNEYEVIVQGEQTPTGGVLHRSLEDAEFTARILDTNYSIAALHLVRHRLGVALVHPMALTAVPGIWDDIVCVPFEPAVYQTLGVILPKFRPVPRSASHFQSYVQQRLEALSVQMRARGLDCQVLAVEGV